MARGAGFSIAEIRALLKGFAPDAAPGRAWRSLAAQKLGELALLMAQIATFHDRLQGMLRCNCASIATCPLCARPSAAA